MSDFQTNKRKPVDPTDTVPRCEILEGKRVWAEEIDQMLRNVIGLDDAQAGHFWSQLGSNDPVMATVSQVSGKAIITIPGTPVAKGRPRSAIRHGEIHHYTPAKTVAHERSVGWYAQQHFTAPITGPITLRIFATFVPPASWSRKKVAAHLHRPHMSLPDLDNIAKAICDGLNGVAFKDDRQVYELQCRKVWGITAQTVVIVEWNG